MSSQDSHSAHATDDYRQGWDRIFAGKKHVDCARHKSAEPDMRERCSCPPNEIARDPRIEVAARRLGITYEETLALEEERVVDAAKRRGDPA